MITRERVLELLDYNPETGEFRWKVDRNGYVRRGSIAGTDGGKGYIQIKIDGVSYKAHRLAWFITYGTWPRSEIDHINGTRYDNRISNLREATASMNCQNKKRPRADSTTGFIGVSPNGSGYRARIVVGGERRCLGTYHTPEEAHQAYIEAKRRYHEGNTL